MVGRRVPGAQTRPYRRGRRKKRASPGLKILDRDGYWHIHGTVRVKGRSRRVRESTGLSARPENWDAADAIRRQRENQVVDQVVHGIKPTASVSVAADRLLDRVRNPG
jgi:hypothetical protein